MLDVPTHKKLSGILNDPAFLSAVKKSNSVKHTLLKGEEIEMTPFAWFTAENRIITTLDTAADKLFTEITGNIERLKNIAFAKMLVLFSLLLLTFYMFYLFKRLIPFLLKREGLERLLDKTLEHAVIEDTIDLDTTEGIDKSYQILEQSIDKISVENAKRKKPMRQKVFFLPICLMKSARRSTVLSVLPIC